MGFHNRFSGDYAAMFNLTDELFAVLRIFSQQQIDYALCGGFAMAVHGFARHTVDIDILILNPLRAIAAAQTLGFESPGIHFDYGEIQIDRLLKYDGELPLDLVQIADPKYQWIWEDREEVDVENMGIMVVDPVGMVALKQFRSGSKDRIDIAWLQEHYQLSNYKDFS